MTALGLVGNFPSLKFGDSSVERKELPIALAAIGGIEVDASAFEPCRKLVDIDGAATNPINALDNDGRDVALADPGLHFHDPGTVRYWGSAGGRLVSIDFDDIEIALTRCFAT